MKHKIVLAILLCLATAWTIGATPAAAQAACDCHTAVPPTNGAPAAHAPLVVGVNCATCHKWWTVPHPARVREQGLTLRRGADAGELWGQLYHVWGWGFTTGHHGVVVYLQQRLWGASEFTDLAQVTTNRRYNARFHYTVKSPAKYASYRAIAQSWRGSGVVYLPTTADLLLTPTVTLSRLVGPVGGVLKLGDALTASGTVAPSPMAGQPVALRFQKAKAGKWVRVVSLRTEVTASDTFSRDYTPASHGKYRVQARMPATEVHGFTMSAWRKFLVQ